MRVILTLVLFSNFSMAMSFDDIKIKTRNALSPYLSKSIITTLFGEKKVQGNKAYVMPTIPKLDSSAIDNSVYDKKEIELKKSSFGELSRDKQQYYNMLFLKELYLVISKERVDDDTLATYLNRFSQGVSREGIYRSLISGKKYYELESNPSVASDRLVAFTNNFSQKYLNTKYNQSVLKNNNKHTIRKTLTEKALDLMSFFSKEPTKLYTWYAILSADLSNEPTWKSSARKNSSEEFHYQWARSAPFDHIKSEVIIKINKTVNAL